MTSPVLALLLVVAAAASACGSTDAVAELVGSPCTRTSDCQKGLSCVGGVCRAPDTGSPTDAGGDATDATGSDAGSG